MNPDAGSMSELPGSFEALDLSDVPDVARSRAALRCLEAPVLGDLNRRGSAGRR
jgi:hypothetical protein